MRKFAAAWVLVGCAHPGPDHASGKDRRPGGAHMMWVGAHPDTHRSRVDTSAGDRTDWVHVRLATSGEVALRLTLEPTNTGAWDVAATIYGLDGAELTRFTAADGHAMTASLTAPPERTEFYVVIYATGWDDAATYQLDASLAPDVPVPLIGALPPVPEPGEGRAVFDPEYHECDPQAYRRDGVTCNPPPPGMPPTLEAPIADVSEDGDSTIITIRVGSEFNRHPIVRLHVRGLDAKVEILNHGRFSTTARVAAPIDAVLATKLIVDIN